MLNDAKIKKATPEAKPKRLTDERGLYLILRPNGARWWRFDYRFNGTRKTISFGVYPEVTLAEARDRRDAARLALRDRKDPSEARRGAGVIEADVPFSVILKEWARSRAHTIAPATKVKQDGLIAGYITPALGAMNVRAVTAPIVLAIVQPIDKSGRHETAHAVKRIIGQALRYAVATGRAERDSTQDLQGFLPPVKTTHHAAVVTPKAVGALLRAIHEDGGGSVIVSLALQLAPLVFVRPGELRAAEWAEIDWPHHLWRIPAHRMKARAAHVVPLSRQALAILKAIQPLTGSGRYIFPALRDRTTPMSENTLNMALIRLGYERSQQTPHGFRTIASTLMNERGEPSELVELQLAHKDPNAPRAAYNRAQKLKERTELMQRWADYLDELRTAKI